MTNFDTVRLATRADVPGLASVLARAFHDDPVTSWIMPDPRQRARLLPAVYARQLRTWFLDHGVAEVCHQDGRIMAGSLWASASVGCSR